MTKKRINGENLTRAEMLGKAMELVKQGGYTWDQIAEKSGYQSRGSAYRAVKTAMAKMTDEPAAELVALETARLDMLQNALWDHAMKGTAKMRVAAVRQILGIMARRAKLLGLDDFERRSIELAERKHALNNSQAQLVYEFMNRVMNAVSLTPAQREMLPEIIPGELARITEQMRARPELTELPDDDDDEDSSD